ncbi:MAG: helix-turn-helix domain-containing protein [Dissulfurispiraceae bacterium]
MPIMLAYRYRIRPTKENFFPCHFGCCRFVHNYPLALSSKKWKTEKMGPTRYS